MSQGLIQGSMREAPLPDIIQLVSQGGKTGCFHVADEHRRARIYLKDGRIIHAVSSGSTGLDAVYEVALWLDGTYHFEERDPGAEITITKPNPTILMEMHRRMDEWRVISHKIPSLDLHPYSTLLPGEAVSGVNPREAKLLALLTGYYTVAELAEVLGRPVLSIAKDLYGLVMAGHVVFKGVRGGRRPEVPLTPEARTEFTPVPAPVSAPSAAPLAAPVPAPVRLGEELTGSGTAEGVEIRPASRPLPAQDSARLAKLTGFTQRIVQTAKDALPTEYHGMITRCQARTTQELLLGEGPEAVKNLALAVSRGAVEAGCDGDTVRNLNASLKALFAR
jgi:hypothetical protein